MLFNNRFSIREIYSLLDKQAEENEFFLNLSIREESYTLGIIQTTYNNCFRLNRLYDKFYNGLLMTHENIFKQNICSFGELKKRIYDLIAEIDTKYKQNILTNKLDKLNTDF